MAKKTSAKAKSTSKPSGKTKLPVVSKARVEKFSKGGQIKGK